MFFYFLKYINPIWYYHISNKSNFSYFVDIDLLEEHTKNLVAFDEGYSNKKVSKLDAAYQLWNKGVIEDGYTKKLEINPIEASIKDNYRFVRRFFHPIWSWYILMLRLTTLNNPLLEIKSFFDSRNTKRIKLFTNIYSHLTKFNSFHSQLLINKPKVTVVIPTLNRYIYLQDVLHDLEQQNYTNFDVIVVDQSEPFQNNFYNFFKLDLKLIRQQEKALWLARDTAILASDAEYFLLFDDDSRVEPDWISQHLKCIEFFQADISSGISISTIGSRVPENYSFFRWGDQIDTGNVLIKRKVFNQIGLFDRQFEKQRMGDGEFGLRAHIAGFKNISNPLAKRIHLKVSEGGLRQMGSWDGFRPKSWFAPRPVPSVLYLIRKYFNSKTAIFTLLIGTPPSLMPYRFKRNPKLLILGSLLIFPLLPLVIWQVWKSWKLSTAMLKEGSKIENLT